MRYQPCICFALLSALAIAPLHAADRHIAREKIEWCDVWITDAATDEPASNLPRVLLIGDSITRAYYPDVAKQLAGKAEVSRLATSSSVGDPALIKQLRAILSENRFDVIHFNNGMHGWNYTEAEYRQYFPEFVGAIRELAPKARLVWATTTPVRQKGAVATLDPKTERVKARNAIAAEYLAKSGVPTDDLFHLVENHPEYYKDDGVHFNAPGSAAQAAQVAAAVEKLLPAAAKP
jgi:hypothetical protein